MKNNEGTKATGLGMTLIYSVNIHSDKEAYIYHNIVVKRIVLIFKYRTLFCAGVVSCPPLVLIGRFTR